MEGTFLIITVCFIVGACVPSALGNEVCFSTAKLTAPESCPDGVDFVEVFWEYVECGGDVCYCGEVDPVVQRTSCDDNECSGNPEWVLRPDNWTESSNCLNLVQQMPICVNNKPDDCVKEASRMDIGLIKDLCSSGFIRTPKTFKLQCPRCFGLPEWVCPVSGYVLALVGLLVGGCCGLKLCSTCNVNFISREDKDSVSSASSLGEVTAEPTRK